MSVLRDGRLFSVRLHLVGALANGESGLAADATLLNISPRHRTGYAFRADDAQLTTCYRFEMLSDDRAAPKTLSEDVYTRLQADLLACKFMPGDRLRLESLKAMYRVGFSPLREALTRLTGDGLVTSVGQKGFRVSPVSLQDAQDILVTRQRIDDLILPDALTHGDSEWEARVAGAYHLLMKTPHFEGPDKVVSARWSQVHKSFHYALIAAAPSRLMKQFWLMTFDQMDRYRRLAVSLGSQRRNEAKEHTLLKDAVLARNAKRACAMSRAHNESTLEVIRAVLTATGVVAGRHTGPSSSPRPLGRESAKAAAAR